MRMSLREIFAWEDLALRRLKAIDKAHKAALKKIG